MNGGSAFSEDFRRDLLRVAGACFILAALIGVIALLVGELGETEGKIATTALLITVLILLASPGLALIDQGGFDGPLGWLGGLSVLSAILTAAIATWALWAEPEGQYWELFGVLLTWTLVAAQAALLLSRGQPQDSPRVDLLIKATIATGITLGLIISVMLLSEELEDSEGLGRLLGALAVLDALGLLLAPIARRLDATTPTPPQPQGGAGRPSLGAALGLERRGSAVEAHAWELSEAEFDAAIERARGLGVDVAEALGPDRGVGVAVLRDSDGSPLILIRRSGPAA